MTLIPATSSSKRPSSLSLYEPSLEWDSKMGLLVPTSREPFFGIDQLANHNIQSKLDPNKKKNKALCRMPFSDVL